MKKLKESNDEKKIKLAKRLARYYGIFHNIGYITTNPDFPFEEDKYGLHYVYCYLENFVDTAKISITGVIKALADDEQLDPFCKYLMFTHMYTPEQVKEIEHEEIYKREKSLKKMNYLVLFIMKMMVLMEKIMKFLVLVGRKMEEAILLFLKKRETKIIFLKR